MKTGLPTGTGLQWLISRVSEAPLAPDQGICVPMLRPARDHNLIYLVFLLGIALAGCAGLSIPAPDATLKPLSEPLVPDSTIILPVSFSVSSIMNIGNSAGPRAGIRGLQIRGFLQRQGLRKENLAQNPFIRQQVGRAWDSLQKPVRLKNDLSLFLQPRSVSLSALSEEGTRCTSLPRLSQGRCWSRSALPLPGPRRRFPCSRSRMLPGRTDFTSPSPWNCPSTASQPN